ncbi:protein containing von Willebrand factor type A (vWA) domain [Hoeflea sp. IMCC20628]|uniref:vWA domain-containing protein n=1 Tax=Hoeflea sp. IMCC20628 TaxID=1620421 RepID=UPI00063AECAC|nr:VWA domain-containing protein [Hoeflea sp. IMCC20628]AKI01894.1 protein containing von Willebrand factor type A (vWA) domain [Hoeflea sp. IMCC20628]
MNKFLVCDTASVPGELPRGSAPLFGFARLLRRFGFAIAPEQAIAFMQAVTLLGPRSMDDIRRSAVATFAPAPERRVEFDALFESWFHGEARVNIEGEGQDEDEPQIKDNSDTAEEETGPVQEETGGELTSGTEQLSIRAFANDGLRLDALERKLGSALPCRRSFRTVRTATGKNLDIRRSMRKILSADGDIPSPQLRRQQRVPRRLLLLLDVSGSMKLHTEDYLKVAYAAVHGTGRAEVFCFGTRLTRLTSALRIRNREQALAQAAALVEDWDGGTRIGGTLLAFLSVPRFSAFARGAVVVILSDALERGEPTEMESAFRRFAASAHRLSLATPLAGDPRFRPETEALRAILPTLDDLVDGSSVAGLTKFLLSLGRAAPQIETMSGRGL